MRRFIPIILVLCLILMSGCSKDKLAAGKGSEFIGTWHSKAYSIEIKRNGDSFILVMFRGKEQPKEFPATLSGDVLHVSNGVGTVQFSHVKADDTLLTNGKSFTRQK
ncbi:hypothetical protein [Megalodesulfovibrio paquesii]